LRLALAALTDAVATVNRRDVEPGHCRVAATAVWMSERALIDPARSAATTKLGYTVKGKPTHGTYPLTIGT
jgi:hypothetical protein